MITKTAKRKATGRRLTSAQVRSFQEKIYSFYRAEARDLPWRKNITPYRVLVSEIMLQQTQVERVTEKYGLFVSAFSDFHALATASLSKLLFLWQGLGYNRRALALQALAIKVVREHNGRLPSKLDALLALPGVGPYTAGAVLAFAFNKPVAFIDTNIRRVHLYHFFHGRENILDEDIKTLVEQTLDTDNPRTWYNALMDYGTMLKKNHANPNRKSAHYTRQKPFENSNRQVRGNILKILVQGSALTAEEISKKTGIAVKRVRANLLLLQQEGFLHKKEHKYSVR
jgi:A/G-specific adenine glycosylase